MANMSQAKEELLEVVENPDDYVRAKRMRRDVLSTVIQKHTDERDLEREVRKRFQEQATKRIKDYTGQGSHKSAVFNAFDKFRDFEDFEECIRMEEWKHVAASRVARTIKSVIHGNRSGVKRRRLASHVTEGMTNPKENKGLAVKELLNQEDFDKLSDIYVNEEIQRNMDKKLKKMTGWKNLGKKSASYFIASVKEVYRGVQTVNESYGSGLTLESTYLELYSNSRRKSEVQKYVDSERFGSDFVRAVYTGAKGGKACKHGGSYSSFYDECEEVLAIAREIFGSRFNKFLSKIVLDNVE